MACPCCGEVRSDSSTTAPSHRRWRESLHRALPLPERPFLPAHPFLWRTAGHSHPNRPTLKGALDFPFWRLTHSPVTLAPRIRASKEWARRDSNPEPRDYESPALTVELQALWQERDPMLRRNADPMLVLSPSTCRARSWQPRRAAAFTSRPLFDLVSSGSGD